MSAAARLPPRSWCRNARGGERLRQERGPDAFAQVQVAQQAAEKASAEVAASEKKMVDVFKQRGLSVAEVNVDDFRNTVLEKVPFKQYGYEKSDWEKIQAVK